jgi:hypothetical protein
MPSFQRAIDLPCRFWPVVVAKLRYSTRRYVSGSLTSISRGKGSRRSCIRRVGGTEKTALQSSPPAIECWCERREADRGLWTRRFELRSHHGNRFVGSDPVNVTTWFFSGLSSNHVVNAFQHHGTSQSIFGGHTRTKCLSLCRQLKMRG